VKGGEKTMKRGLISVGILAGFLLSILMVTVAFAQKDVAVLDNTYGQIKFNHKKHVDLKYDCLRCHHTWKKGETSGKLCVDCHKAKAEGKTLKAQDAFHKDCQGCHQEASKAKKPAGPTACTKCHDTKIKKK
jgi:hypothetical protein